MSVHGGFRKQSHPMRLEYGKQRNEPVDGGEDLLGVCGRQEHSDLVEEKAKVKQTWAVYPV